MRLISCALLLLALGCTAGRALADPAPFCGTSASPPDSWEHVVWIWFENHGYDEIVGSAAAPFINRTLIAGCGLATNAHNETHPSLPNYIAATSGLPPGRLGRWTSDCNATAGCLTRAPSLFGQAPSWGAYAESMPKPCVHWFTGPYAASHNPAVYYRALADCPLHDVPYARLQQDLDADTLPAFVFVTPNMCHDMHNCPVETGDTWLAHAMRALVASAAYQRGTMAIFVTVDEGEHGRSDHCAFNTPTRVSSPSSSSRRRPRHALLFNHYSPCEPGGDAGITDYLGARNAHSMRAAFNL